MHLGYLISTMEIITAQREVGEQAASGQKLQSESSN
jgi:hypothetical protein